MYHSYEDYSSTSAAYDDNRVPVGLRVIVDLLGRGGTPVERQRLLDAGCGTGSYLVELDQQLHALHGLEFDPGMLLQARKKLGRAENVTLCRGSVLAMPFADGSFDAVMFNQVLHHVEESEHPAATGWPNLQRALAEARRALRAGGALIINTCAQRQLRDGLWYTPLIPEAVLRIARRYAPVATLRDLLVSLDFDVGEPVVPLEEVFYGERGLDPTGPFDKSWRDGDSVWSLTSAEELQACLRKLGEMKKAHELDAFEAW